MNGHYNKKFSISRQQQFAPPTPPGMRRELSALVFDLLIDGIDPTEAEQRIHDAAKSSAEADAAIGRYRLVAGCSKVGVAL